MFFVHFESQLPALPIVLISIFRGDLAVRTYSDLVTRACTSTVLRCLMEPRFPPSCSSPAAMTEPTLAAGPKEFSPTTVRLHSRSCRSCSCSGATTTTTTVTLHLLPYKAVHPVTYLCHSVCCPLSTAQVEEASHCMGLQDPDPCPREVLSQHACLPCPLPFNPGLFCIPCAAALRLPRVLTTTTSSPSAAL
jgi:hypothetical protein